MPPPIDVRDACSSSGCDQATAKGVSSHYKGPRGSAYHDWQAPIGEVGASLNLFKFAPQIQPTDTVVDFGCGTGGLLANIVCAKRLAVEVNVDSARIAKSRGIEVFANARELPMGIADVVITNHALEHTLDPLSELVCLRDALRAGGRLLAVVPCERDSRAYAPGDINHHLFTWTPLTFGNLLDEAGYRVESSVILWHAWRTGYLKFAGKPWYGSLAWATAHLLHRPQVQAVAVKDG
jgi:SAM-dependent methyltransferase